MYTKNNIGNNIRPFVGTLARPSRVGCGIGNYCGAWSFGRFVVGERIVIPTRTGADKSTKSRYHHCVERRSWTMVGEGYYSNKRRRKRGRIMGGGGPGRGMHHELVVYILVVVGMILR